MVNKIYFRVDFIRFGKESSIRTPKCTSKFKKISWNCTPKCEGKSRHIDALSRCYEARCLQPSRAGTALKCFSFSISYLSLSDMCQYFFWWQFSRIYVNTSLDDNFFPSNLSRCLGTVKSWNNSQIFLYLVYPSLICVNISFMSSSIRNSSYIVHKTCVKITEWSALSGAVESWHGSRMFFLLYRIYPSLICVNISLDK